MRACWPFLSFGAHRSSLNPGGRRTVCQKKIQPAPTAVTALAVTLNRVEIFFQHRSQARKEVSTRSVTSWS
jgi:hypothetical protein